ncbi:hypothetical protein BY996DRAFT_8487244 [Phakopsora pachyrhizi]|nr:hypothetical protein BY996DRAFT_8487244 [Phakopsora pachyrhizi]
MKTNWLPLQDQKFIGTVHRVVLSNETVYLDGFFHSKPGSGKYLGASLCLSARAVAGKTRHLQSVTDARKASSSFGSLGLPQLSTLQMQKARSSSSSLNPGRLGVPFEQTSLTGSRNAMKPSLSSQMEESRPAQSFFTPNLNSLSPPTIGLERHPAFHCRHILSVQQFTRQDHHSLFSVAQEMCTQVERSGVLDILKGKVMCSMFYEPLTQTSASFEAAMNQLGGRVVSVLANKSSATKGENISVFLVNFSSLIIAFHISLFSSRSKTKDLSLSFKMLLPVCNLLAYLPTTVFKNFLPILSCTSKTAPSDSSSLKSIGLGTMSQTVKDSQNDFLDL